MSDDKKGRFHFLIANRGLFEDIFLYFILVAVISFSSWFLINAQQDFNSKLPKPTETQTFLDALNNESKTESQTTKKDAVSAKFDKNYLAYLQAQANLNKYRYELGSQLIVASTTRKNISFLLGILLSLIGCIVIVRRIRQMGVSAHGKSIGQELKIVTASPGVLLVILGSIIILTTIIRQDTVGVKDFEPMSPFMVSTNDDKPDEDLKNSSKKELDDLEKKIEALPDSEKEKKDE